MITEVLLDFRQITVAGRYPEGSAIRHCLLGIRDNIAHCLLQLAFIGVNQVQVGVDIELHGHLPLRKGAFKRPLQYLGQVCWFQPWITPFRKGEDFLCEFLGLEGGLLHRTQYGGYLLRP